MGVKIQKLVIEMIARIKKFVSDKGLPIAIGIQIDVSLESPFFLRDFNSILAFRRQRGNKEMA